MLSSRVKQRYPGPLPFGLLLDVSLASFAVQRWYGGAYLPMVENIDYEIIGSQIKILTAISDEGELLILSLIEDLTDIEEIIHATREKPAGFVPLGEEYINSNKKFANQIRHGVGEFSGTVAPTNTPSKDGAIFKIAKVGKQTFDDGGSTIDESWRPSIKVSTSTDKIWMENTNSNVEPIINSVKQVTNMNIYATNNVKVRQQKTRPKSIGLGYRRQVSDSTKSVKIKRTFPLVSGYVPYIHIVLEDGITIERDGVISHNVKNLQPFDRVIDADRTNYVIGSTLAIDIGLKLRLWVLDDKVGPSMKYGFNAAENEVTVNSSGDPLPFREWSMERAFLDYVLPSGYKKQSVVVKLFWDDLKYNVTLSDVVRLYNTLTTKWSLYQGFYHSDYFKTTSVADIFVFYTSMVEK